MSKLSSLPKIKKGEISDEVTLYVIVTVNGKKTDRKMTLSQLRQWLADTEN